MAVKDMVQRAELPAPTEIRVEVESRDPTKACRCYVSAMKALGYSEIYKNRRTPLDDIEFFCDESSGFTLEGRVPAGATPKLGLTDADRRGIDIVARAQVVVEKGQRTKRIPTRNES